MDPAFRTKREPHLTADLLRQGWHGLKGAVPDWAQRGMQKVEDWGDRSSATAAAEGALQSLAPGDMTDVGLSALGPAARFGGKAVTKAVGGATALMAGTEDAEAAQGMRRVLYDLIRKHGGDVTKAKTELQGMTPSMSTTDRSQATKVLKLELPPAVVQRELMTQPGQNVHDILHNLRNQTYLKPEEAFKVGDVAVPVAGDTTRAGVNVTRAGIPLNKPVALHGGHDYGLTVPTEQGVSWASEPAAATSKQINFNKAEGLVTGDGEVKGIHVAMAPEGANFAKHTGDLWREMLASGPTIEAPFMQAFNKDVKRQIGTLPGKNPEANKAKALRAWKGVQDPGLDELLNTNPDARKSLLATAAKPGWAHAGFPDIDELYGAALDPTLQTGNIGGAIMRAAPGAELTPGMHPTYSMNIPGEHMGRLAVPLPPEMLFGEQMSRFGPAERGQALGSLRTKHHMQPIDQRFIDDASRYTEARLKALRQGSY